MKIEVWSDFVCPFCYIGKRRLEKALNDFSHKENVTVEYRSYELNPSAEITSTKTMHELIAHKYGISVKKAQAMNENISNEAKEVGLTYHFDTMQHTNTFDAHRVAQYASRNGKGIEMTERLLYAYFTESLVISDHKTLVKLAEEIGLNGREVAEILSSNDYINQVRYDEKQAQQIGVKGVPFFVFNETYGLSGAQRPEVLKEVLEKVWEAENNEQGSQSFHPKKSQTSYCTDEGCEIKEK